MSLNLRLKKIANVIGGKLMGDGEVLITGVGSLKNAKKGEITFIRDKKNIKLAFKTKASALISPVEIEGLDKPYIIIKNPMLAFSKLLKATKGSMLKQEKGIHPRAVLGKHLKLGKDVFIGANSTIGKSTSIGNNSAVYPNTYVGDNVTIGQNTIIYANVSIRENVHIGDNCIIHGGATIGADGFGFVKVGKAYKKIHQIGTVIIEDNVEVGANVTIDRATLDATIIKRGVKIDNHSHVAHNVIVGEDSILVAYCKIAGSSVIGKCVTIAEDVGITDNITIGDYSVIGGGSRVYKSIPPKSIVWGSPAKPINDEKKIQAILRRLPDIKRRLKKIEDTLK